MEDKGGVEMVKLNAEWIDFRMAYRLYDPNHPVDTVAYVDDLQTAERDAIENGYSGVVEVL